MPRRAMSAAAAVATEMLATEAEAVAVADDAASAPHEPSARIQWKAMLVSAGYACARCAATRSSLRCVSVGDSRYTLRQHRKDSRPLRVVLPPPPPPPPPPPHHEAKLAPQRGAALAYAQQQQSWQPSTRVLA